MAGWKSEVMGAALNPGRRNSLQVISSKQWDTQF